MPSLTTTNQPAACASASAGPADGSSTFQVDCTAANSGRPATVTVSAARTVSACAGPLVERPTRTPSSARAASRSCRAGSVRAGLSGVTECTR